MIKLCEWNECNKKQYRCNTVAITNNLHLPNENGELLGAKLIFGDELYNIDNGDTYIWNTTTWVLQ